MKLITETQIADRIERMCRKDLDTHKRAGIDRAPLLMLLANFGRRRGKRMSEETVKKLRYYHSAAKKSAIHAENLALDLRASMEKPPYLKPSPESPFEKAVLGMEFLATSKRKDSRAMGKYLRRNGRKSPDITYYVLGWILKCNPDFNCWESLSRLLYAAFNAASVDADEKEMKHLSAEACRKAATRYLQREAVWTAKENDTWPQS